MDSATARGVTELLLAWRDGCQDALEELMPIVYGDLRKLARIQLRRERPDHTLQPTALAHEAFLRLVGQRRVRWHDRAHFFAVAAQTMRRILVDYARRRRAGKRGGSATRVTLDETVASVEPFDVDLIALHESLSLLEKMDPRQVRIVELRYFGGLSVEEVAKLLDLSPRTVKGDWAVAKLWLKRELERARAK